MKMSEKVDKILPKLAEALKELGNVKKSSDNPFFKSKYADLNTHLEVVETALEKQGLLLLQPADVDERGTFVESMVIDPQSSQFVSSRMHLILTKNNMQDAGSAVTYARRYTLGSLLSMQAVDDDGEVAVGRGKSATIQASLPAPTKARSSFRKAVTTISGSTVTTDTSTLPTTSASPSETTEEWS